MKNIKNKIAALATMAMLALGGVAAATAVASGGAEGVTTTGTDGVCYTTVHHDAVPGTEGTPAIPAVPGTPAIPAVDQWYHWNGGNTDSAPSFPDEDFNPDNGNHNGLENKDDYAPNTVFDASNENSPNADWFYHEVVAEVPAVPGTPEVPAVPGTDPVPAYDEQVEVDCTPEPPCEETLAGQMLGCEPDEPGEPKGGPKPPNTPDAPATPETPTTLPDTR